LTEVSRLLGFEGIAEHSVVVSITSDLLTSYQDLSATIESQKIALEQSQLAIHKAKAIIQRLQAKVSSFEGRQGRWNVDLDVLASVAPWDVPTVSRGSQTPKTQGESVLAQKLAEARGEIEGLRAELDMARHDRPLEDQHSTKESRRRWATDLPLFQLSVPPQEPVAWQALRSSARAAETQEPVASRALREAEQAAAKWRSQAELAERAAELADRVAVAAEGAKQGAIESLEHTIRSFAGKPPQTHIEFTAPLETFRDLSSALKELSSSIKHSRSAGGPSPRKQRPADIELEATIDLHSASVVKKAIQEILRQGPKVSQAKEWGSDPPVAETPLPEGGASSRRLRKSDLFAGSTSRVSSRSSKLDPQAVDSMWTSGASLKVSRKRVDGRHSIRLAQ